MDGCSESEQGDIILEELISSCHQRLEEADVRAEQLDKTRVFQSSWMTAGAACSGEPGEPASILRFKAMLSLARICVSVAIWSQFFFISQVITRHS